MLIGYARVSTDDQQLDLQLDALEAAGCEKIFCDRMSGSRTDRPGLAEAFEYMRQGDTLVVWRLDRLGRSMKDLIAHVTMMGNNGVELKSLQESMDTSTSTGMLIFHVFGALAEFERALIRERTNAGLAAARSRGRIGGRPKALTPEQCSLAQKMYDEKKYSIAEICKILGISKPTLYNNIKKSS